jgi:hypothetical protein
MVDSSMARRDYNAKKRDYSAKKMRARPVAATPAPVENRIRILAWVDVLASRS